MRISEWAKSRKETEKAALLDSILGPSEKEDDIMKNETAEPARVKSRWGIAAAAACLVLAAGGAFIAFGGESPEPESKAPTAGTKYEQEAEASNEPEQTEESSETAPEEQASQAESRFFELMEHCLIADVTVVYYNYAAVEEGPTMEAICDVERVFGDAAAAERVVFFLEEDYGIEPGDRLLVAIQPNPEWHMTPAADSGCVFRYEESEDGILLTDLMAPEDMASGQGAAGALLQSFTEGDVARAEEWLDAHGVQYYRTYHNNDTDILTAVEYGGSSGDPTVTDIGLWCE